ncbi:RagB/SusD family nutrient uptake outer membrane protein [Labilibacter sediminis]|nr:RagB/SusD family nutrient uptake outer membrane protein [Labilibacter sediminis]
MRRKNIYLYTLIFFIGVTTYSCESFFDVKPEDSTVVDETLQTERDAQIMLNGIYASFMSSASYGTYLTVLTDMMTDVTLAATGYSNQYGDPYAWKIYPGTSETSAVWANHYAAIFNANFLINNIAEVPGDEDNLNRITGEAYVARALLHYNLVRLYAKAYGTTSSTDLGVPYVTYNKISSPKRNTVEEVYQFIIADLEQALNLMPDVSSYDKNYFSVPMVNGLLARVALDMKNYEDAIKYSSEVIGSTYLSLSTIENYENMWINDEGSEIIWRVGYTATDAGAAIGYNFFNRNSFTQYPTPDYIPADWWIELLEEYDNDIRRQKNVVETYTLYGWTGNLLNKYPTNPMFDNQGVNMPKPMRLAEMYLIRAEAYTYLGGADNEGKAVDDLNKLGNHRIHNFPEILIDKDTGASVDLKEYIIKERQKELMFEGFYYFDLKRMGKGFERTPQSNTTVANDLFIEGDDYRWQWPIPTSELNGNDIITQNDGY